MFIRRRMLDTAPIAFLVLAACQAARAEIIKGPYVQNVTTSGITIMWESDRPTIGLVQFGRAPDYGSVARGRAKIRTDETSLSTLGARPGIGPAPGGLTRHHA